MKSLLLKNARILKGADFEEIRGFLGVRGKFIDYIGEARPEAAYDEEKDMHGAILMPGLYNAHSHAAMTVLRGLGSGLPLERWLNDVIFPTETRLTPEIVAAGNALAQLEMIACGTVSCTDMYDFPGTFAEFCHTSGMKCNVNRPILSFSDTEKLEDMYRFREEVEAFEKYNNTAEGRVRIDLSVHAVYTNKLHILEAFSRFVQDKGARMHLHLSETRTEVENCRRTYGKSPVALFNDIGIFNVPTTAAHCVVISDDDIRIIKEKGVFPAHCPSSNMKLCSGISPVRKMLDAGIPVALGTDGTASNNNLNMFEEMHIASLLGKIGADDPLAIPAKQALLMATRHGALSQGREDCGLLETGFKADIVAVSTDGYHMYPIFDVRDILVYSAQGSDVVMTMVDGKILLENGEFKTLNPEKILADAKQAVEKLYGTAY